jgi:hypothetical protein
MVNSSSGEKHSPAGPEPVEEEPSDNGSLFHHQTVGPYFPAPSFGTN